ncbi:hypothetical protein SNK03_003365 [Fusarium graminearum]|uniref:Uncharacterized protein n=1 Tax=Gibberella zeae TaxID=5518 RepID=A0A2H3GM42_GIBZA|nr:hypothetical protein HG531_008031 [Fusarium graminearum]PCD31631.1 hypothetical protein FGRA07_10174 [Fusarium graminearum]CAF3566726.1 unnamed protein product [Fusarium graminearum]CAF3644372.1 unnamed protein product [Fusarium graminearum]CAG1959386.1 unnamed protein product [Fusarium graminearum]
MIPTTATTTSKTGWPTTSSALRELLNIDNGNNIKCHGQCQSGKNTGKRCGIAISKINSKKIASLSDQIVDHGSFCASESLLSEMALLTMCPRFHRNQASGRLSLWETILKPIKKVAFKKEDEDDSLTTHKEDVSESLDADIVEVKHKVLSKNEKSISKITNHHTSQPIPSTPTKPFISSTPSTPSKQSPPKVSTPKHEFEDFGPAWTVIKINKDIRKLLLRPLLDTEKKSDGFIYAYLFPETYRDANPHIKIGYAHDVEKRMKDWKAQCGYNSKVICQFAAEHYVKVEKLVHRQLRNQRKREKECPTCHVSHQEWFKTKSTTASKNIMMWTSWMRQKPYDDDGYLEEKWRTRIEGLDLTDPSCWEMLTEGVFDDDEDESELSEGDSFAWSNKDESEFSEDEVLDDLDNDVSEVPLIDDRCSGKESLR